MSRIKSTYMETSEFRRNVRHYKIECPRCGGIFVRKWYTQKREMYCDDCQEKARAEAKAEKIRQRMELPEIIDERQERFLNACAEMELIHGDRYEEYKTAIRTLSRHTEKFDSVAEAMACIELIHAGEKIIPQQKVGQYRVDICIPDRKTVIEIDGEHWHKRRNMERDARINKALGYDWIIVHIPDSIVRDDTRKILPYVEEYERRNR